MTTRRPGLLLLNPNTTTAMTEAMAAQITARAGDRAAVAAMTAAFGHPVIASRVSYAIAAHAVVDMVDRHGPGADAIILGCFGDPGLEAVREMTGIPVIGLAEAAFLQAAEHDEAFAVLTVGPAWGPMLRERLALTSAAALCVAVRTLDGTGLDYAGHPDHLVAALDAAAAALVADGARTIILGGAALAGLAPRMTATARYIDCVTAATDLALARLGV